MVVAQGFLPRETIGPEDSIKRKTEVSAPGPRRPTGNFGS